MALTDTDIAADLTAEEVRAAIEAFDDAMLVRLKRVAGYYAQGRGVSPDDLLQEAVLKALDGERICPRKVPVASFLCGAMKSLASAAYKKLKAAPEQEPVTAEAEGGARNERLATTDPGPEEQLLSKDEANKMVNALDALFADDQEAQLVIAGLCQDMTREEIQAECQLSDTAYETIRRRIRRAIDRQYPKGWKL